MLTTIEEVTGSKTNEPEQVGSTGADARIEFYDLAQQRTRRLLAGCLIAVFTGYALVGGYWLRQDSLDRSFEAPVHLYLTALLLMGGGGFLALNRVDERLYQAFIRTAVIDGALQESRANGALGAGLFLRDFPTKSSVDPIISSIGKLASIALFVGAAVHGFLALRQAPFTVGTILVPTFVLMGTLISLPINTWLADPNQRDQVSGEGRLPHVGPELLLAYAVVGRYSASAVQALIRARPATLRVVLTGGAHSGKTAMARALFERGAQVVPEAAMEVMKERDLLKSPGGSKAAGGTKKKASSRSTKAAATSFQNDVTNRQLRNEANAASLSGVVVFDRSMVDGLAFCAPHLERWRANAPSPPIPAELIPRIREGKGYDLVFVLDTIAPFEQRSETGRTTRTEDESIRAGTVLHRIYTEEDSSAEQKLNILKPHGRVIRVPPGKTIEERADLIWEEITRLSIELAMPKHKMAKGADHVATAESAPSP